MQCKRSRLGMLRIICFATVLWYMVRLLKPQITKTGIHHIESYYARLTPVQLLFNVTRDKGYDNNSLETISENTHQNNAFTKVAIGLAITSFRSTWSNVSDIQDTFPFFHSFLPSFCGTVSLNYSYSFFLGFDKNDTFFIASENQDIFQSLFVQYVKIHCPMDVDKQIHFIPCNHSKHPAWAQNDVMLDAYLSDMEYFYRINDDTLLQTKHWTEIYISILNNFDPPNVGVVGPNHTGGKTDILTYDFVHRTHIDIHGMYYPRTFIDWHADRWITETYKPNRSVKALTVGLTHTKENDRRYHKNKMDLERVDSIVEQSRSLVETYVSCQKTRNSALHNNKGVISMSLYGHNPTELYSAIRTAQLHKCFFRDWSLRFYLLQHVGHKYDSLAVPKRVIRTLHRLGADLMFLNHSYVNIDPLLWRFLVIADESVDYFIIQNTDSRLSLSYEHFVKDWLTSSIPFFSNCDGNNGTSLPVELLGSNIKTNKTILISSVENILRDYDSAENSRQHNEHTRIRFSLELWNVLSKSNVKCYHRTKCTALKNRTDLNNFESFSDTCLDLFDQPLR